MTGLLAMPAPMMLYFFSIVSHSFKCMKYIISFFHPYCLLDSDTVVRPRKLTLSTKVRFYFVLNDLA